MSIFNRRRRPRQAVYASPQSQGVHNKGLTTDEVADEQLVNMAQDFESGQGNYGFVSHGQKPPGYFEKTAANTRPLETRNYPLQKHPNNHFNDKNIPLKQENNFPSNAGMTNSCSYSGRGQQQGMGNQMNRGYNTQKATSKEFHFNKSSLTKQSHQPQQTNQVQRQYTWSNFNNYVHSPAKATTAGPGIARQPVETDRAHSFGAMENQHKKIKVEKPVPMETEVPKPTGRGSFALKTVDKSMKFVTSNIQGARKWSEHRDIIPLVFEIFATLDSVPTSNHNGIAKFFNIKDSTGTIRSVYWEMDQKLPRVARGQIYRLTGAMDRKSGHFQCFTIRQAQLEEQRIAPKQISMCDNALTKHVSMVAEA